MPKYTAVIRSYYYLEDKLEVEANEPFEAYKKGQGLTTLANDDRMTPVFVAGVTVTDDSGKIVWPSWKMGGN